MNANDQNESQHKFTIRCIGIDGLMHECEPHLDAAVCGCQVVNKKVVNYDYAHRYSCYPCTY
jgi:hypothetical protein